MQDLKTVKKRELLDGKGGFNELVQHLISLSGDIAKLELSNNFEASRRVRRGLIDAKNKYIPEFEKKIRETREQIKNKQ